jgi:hypothetical protein
MLAPPSSNNRPSGMAVDGGAVRTLAALLLLVLAECSSPPPPAERIPDERPGWFVDRYARSGIDVGGVSWPLRVGPNNAAALTDCDDDGLPDAYVVNNVSPSALWRNLGSFRFEEVTDRSGARTFNAGAAAFGDLDNDGRPDLLVASGFDDYISAHQNGTSATPMTLRSFRGLGGCRFEETTSAWGFGVRTAPMPTTYVSLVLRDLNVDGVLDVLTARAFDSAAPVWVYVSRPDGTWQEQGAALGPQALGNSWGNWTFDVDDDGWDDLFLFNNGRDGPPALFLARRPTPEVSFEVRSFDDRLFGSTARPTSLMSGMSADVDGDGDLELYLADLGPSHLYQRRPEGWVDVAEEVGAAAATLPDGSPTVAYGSSFADYDNDGFPDIALAVGFDDGFWADPYQVLLHNRGDGTFEDQSLLLDQPGPTFSQWLTATDLDRDGRLDLWFGGEAQVPRILRNEMAAGNWIAVRLRGRLSNAAGVGARVTVVAGNRRRPAVMDAGGNMWGYGEERLSFGLGRLEGVEEIEVLWPSGHLQRTGPLSAGREVVIEEPPLLELSSRVAVVGDSVSVRVRPVDPLGLPLVTGPSLELSLLPGAEPLPLVPQGDGSFIAQWRPREAGDFRLSLAIDGRPLRILPAVQVR